MHADRGVDKTTELLVTWKDNSSARPSWMLRTELVKNPENVDVIDEYYARGRQTVEELRWP